MQVALTQFQENMTRIRGLLNLYHAVDVNTTIIDSSESIIDSLDILRAAHVFSVSALDKFIHEVTRLGMLEAFEGRRIETDAYQKFNLPMKVLSKLQDTDDIQPKLALLSEAISERHGWQSFQRPGKIADALRLVTSISLWEETACKMQLEAKDIKDRLELIVQRRDQIAHEADTRPNSELLPDKRWPITYDMTQQTVEFIEKLAQVIYELITEEMDLVEE